MVQWPLQAIQPGDPDGVVPLKKGGDSRNIPRSPPPDLHGAHCHIVYEHDTVRRTEVHNPFNIRYETTG